MLHFPNIDECSKPVFALGKVKWAIKLNPELSAAYDERGMIYFFQEHYTKMIRDFLKVTKLSPDHANGYAMLGVAMMAAIFLVLIFKLTLPAPKKKKWPDWWNRNK
jgi:tetratricopeptide (TPR) repeat protein